MLVVGQDPAAAEPLLHPEPAQATSGRRWSTPGTTSARATRSRTRSTRPGSPGATTSCPTTTRRSCATPTRASGRRPTSPARSGCSTTSAKGWRWGCCATAITDVNTEDEKQLEGASDALRELIDKVNLRFYTNEYQHLADGSMWLHQAWSGDMAAIGYYMPKGTPASAVSYWWPEDGRGPDRQRHLRRPQGRAAPGPRPPLPRPHARPRRSASSTSNSSATSSR